MDQVFELLNFGFYEENWFMMLNDVFWFDLFYVVFKLFGENLGCYYVMIVSFQFVGFCIGWFVFEDDVSVKKGIVLEDYLCAMFFSK